VVIEFPIIDLLHPELKLFPPACQAPVAMMFRAQALLSGQTFNLKAYLRALMGKM